LTTRDARVIINNNERFMPWLDLLWDDGPGGNVEHIAEHGVTPAEVHQVLEDDDSTHGVSESSGEPLVMGYTRAGRFLVVVYEQMDAFTVKPITAYDVE
jgi:uncharacterized DUF497 family protein